MKKKRLKTLQILLSAFGAAAFGGRHSDCATGCLARGAGWTYLMRASCDSISFSVFSAFVLPGAIRPCATGRPPAGTDHQATVSPARRGRQRHPDEPDRRLSGWRTHDGAIARRRSDHTKAGAAHAVLLRQFRPCLFNQRRWLRHAPQPTGRANPLRGTHCQRAADRALHALSRIQRDDERKPCCSPYRPVHGAGPGGRRYTRLRRHCIYLRLGHSIFLHCCAVQPSSAAQHTAYSFTMLFRGNLRLRQRSRKSASARPCACARLGRNLRALPSAARCIQNKAFPAALFFAAGWQTACLPA